MKKCLFIINPTSGQRTIQKTLDRIIGNLVLKRIVNQFDVYYTTPEVNDARKKARSLKEDDYDFLVVVGGDGTINEVIGGCVEANIQIPIALLAAGTVNDFANYLGLPTTVDKIVAMIANFKTIKSDVGKINQNYFINVAAGGMFSDISFNVSKNDKKRLGPLAYYINGVIDLPSQLRTDIHLKLIIDKEEIETDAMMFVITNSNRVGGFNKIAPFADIHDGLFDIMIIKKCSVTDLIALSKDYLLKKHDVSPFLIYRQGKHIDITCDQNITIDIDGEKGDSLPIHIENIPEAITLLIP